MELLQASAVVRTRLQATRVVGEGQFDADHVPTLDPSSDRMLRLIHDAVALGEPEPPSRRQTQDVPAVNGLAPARRQIQ